NGHDFKLNLNGYLTFFNNTANKWYMLDSAYSIIDSFQCGNGLELFTNAHEFLIFADKHAYVLAFEPRTIDMSQYVPGGDTAAAGSGFGNQRAGAEQEAGFV